MQQELNKIEKYDSSLSQISNLFKESVLNLQEAGSQISSELLSLEFDPDELNSLEQRMNAIESLKRKYGGSIEAVLETKDNIIQEMSSINNPQNSEKELLNTIEEKEKIFSGKAIMVHKNRVLYAKKLANNIERAMSDLNMPG